MKKQLFTILFILSSNLFFSQEIYEIEDAGYETEREKKLNQMNQKFNSEYIFVRPIYDDFFKVSPKTEDPHKIMEYGVVDKEGKAVIDPIYEMMTEINNKGLILIYDVDTQISSIFDLKHNHYFEKNIDDFENIESINTLIYSKDGLSGAMTYNRDTIFPFKYQKIRYINNQFYVLKDNTLTDKKHNFKINNVINFWFDESFFITVNSEKKQSLYTEDFKPLLKNVIDIQIVTETIFVVKEGKKRYLKFPNKEIMVTKKAICSKERSTKNNYVSIQEPHKIRFLDFQGNLVTTIVDFKKNADGFCIDPSEYYKLVELIDN